MLKSFGRCPSLACTSIDGYLSSWDWDWWKSENPREEFEKGTYDIEHMVSEVMGRKYRNEK